MPQRKVHFLKPHRVGLFQHFITYCNQAVDYARDCYCRQYLTGARFDYTNDWQKVTCKTCLNNRQG